MSLGRFAVSQQTTLRAKRYSVHAIEVMLHAMARTKVGQVRNLSLSYFSGRVAAALGRASRRWLHAATAVGGAISINGRNSRNGM